MTSTRTVGTAPPASAATMLRFVGNCTTAISVAVLERVMSRRHPATVIQAAGRRVQPMPVIVRFLPVLQ
jgi:hypothetical protein